MLARRTSSILLFAALATGCAATFPTPAMPPGDPHAPARFDLVAPGVYRSAQPSAAELAYLRDAYGVTAVLKLNSDLEAREPEVGGVEVIRLPLSVVFTPSAAELDAAIGQIERVRRSGGRVLIHCSLGRDRTGLVSAVYRMRHGTAWPQALTDAIGHGWHPYRALWIAFAREARWQ